MTAAVLTFAFDPIVRLAGLEVRAETLGIAAALLIGLVWVAFITGRTPGGDWIGDTAADEEAGLAGPWHLRRDDLLFIAVGAVPGAVLGGRIGYGLLHADYYGMDLRRLLDPGSGSAELTLAVVGGTLTGIYVAALLDAPVGRWLHAAIRPLLIALALGKAAGVLGGSGQGALVPAGTSYATAYAGPGPWGSAAADLPAIPSQLGEAALTLLVLALVGWLGWRTPLRRPDGRLFGVGLGLWALGRGLVATTWRDVSVLGPFSAEQLIALPVGLLALGLATLAWLARRRGRRPAIPGA